MTKLTVARTLRIVLAIALLLVISVILWYVLSHRRPPSVIPPKVDDITAKKVERQEGIEHFDFRGERVIQAKAKRHYAGEDNRYHLEGDVVIRDLRKKNGEEVVISGDRAAYDKDWDEALLEGNAEVKYGDLTFKSSAFFYSKKKEVLSTDKGVTFSSPKVSGKALKLEHSFEDETMRLDGQVELELRDETQKSTPFVATGDAFIYDRRQKLGRIEGSANYTFGASRGEADSIQFTLTADEQYFRSFDLKGHAKTDLVEEESRISSEGKSPRPSSRMERKITAGDIHMTVFLNTHKVHAVEARGDCVLASYSPDGTASEIRSGDMKILFDHWGGLREFSAWNGATMEDRGKNSQVERLITGQEISMGEKGDPLKVEAAEGQDARVDAPDSEITARAFTLYPRREILDADDDVKIILKPRQEEAESVGFFSSGEPVFITAGEMRYEQALNRLLLGRASRIWQGKEMLSADNLTVSKKTGELSGDGRVRAVFSHIPKKEGAPEEKIEVGGEKMKFRPQEHLLTFEQTGWLKTREIRLDSNTVQVHLQEKGGKIRTIVAKGKVIITAGLRQGKGEDALYDLEQETIILTGNPTLTDQEKGVIEGEKLTFRLGDGRIQVENKDRERSITIIKS